MVALSTTTSPRSVAGLDSPQKPGARPSWPSMVTGLQCVPSRLQPGSRPAEVRVVGSSHRPRRRPARARDKARKVPRPAAGDDSYCAARRRSVPVSARLHAGRDEPDAKLAERGADVNGCVIAATDRSSRCGRSAGAEARVTPRSQTPTAPAEPAQRRRHGGSEDETSPPMTTATTATAPRASRDMPIHAREPPRQPRRTPRRRVFRVVTAIARRVVREPGGLLEPCSEDRVGIALTVMPVVPPGIDLAVSDDRRAQGSGRVVQPGLHRADGDADDVGDLRQGLGPSW